jgi:hypothetical protein
MPEGNLDSNLCRAYVDDMAALDREPDLELLAPVIAIFEKSQRDQT